MSANNNPEFLYMVVGGVTVVGLLLKDVFAQGIKSLFRTKKQCSKDHCPDHTGLMVDVQEIKTDVKWLCKENGKPE